MNLEVLKYKSYNAKWFIQILMDSFSSLVISYNNKEAKISIYEKETYDISLEIRDEYITMVHIVDWQGGWEHKRSSITIEFEFWDRNIWRKTQLISNGSRVYNQEVKNDIIIEISNFMKVIGEESMSKRLLRSINLKKLEI